MSNVLFISPQYIKDTSYIDENVDEKLLRPTILETQEMRIRRLVGTAFYNDLQTKINAGTVSSTTGYATLLNDYISPCLKYWVLHDGAYLFSFKIMNKGIVERGSENATNVDTIKLDRLMAHFKDRAEYYQDRVIRYLLENNTAYTLYENPGDGIDTDHPKRNSYTQGWYLGDDDCYPYKNLDVDPTKWNKC